MNETTSGGYRLEEEDKGAVRGDGESCNEEKLGEVHGEGQGACQGLNKARELGEGEPWLLLAMVGHTFQTFNKNDLLEK